MPTPDATLTSRDICNQAVVERILADASVSSLKIAANIQSDNFVTGTAGWKIERNTGSAEFQDVVIRGTLNADDITVGTLDADRIAVDSLDVNKLSAGTIGTHILKLSDSSSSRIESNDGTSLIIRGDGTAVFTNISVTGGSVDGDTVGSGIAAGNITTGTLNADRIGAGTITAAKLSVTSLDAITATMGTLTIDNTLTMASTGLIRTSSGATRVETRFDDPGEIRFYQSGTDSANFGIIDSGNGLLAINSPYAAGGDPTQILLSSVSDAMFFSIDGAERFRITTSGIRVQVGGSAGTPSILLNDANTGFFLGGTDTIAMSTAGTLRVRLNTAFMGTESTGFDASSTAVRWVLSNGGQIQAVQASTIAAAFGRNSDGGVIDFRRSGTQVGTISVTTTNTAYNTSSDERLKTNIRPFASSLDLIRSLPVREWEWKANDDHGIGFVAQEIFPLLPDITSPPDAPLDGDDEPFWSIDYGRLSPWNTRAIQELADLVDELRSEVEVLKAAA